MKSFSKYILFLITLPLFFYFLSEKNVLAQNAPLGTWRAHVPLQSATSVCKSKENIYAACSNGIVSVNMDNHYMETYTKVNGLAEVFTNQVGYDTSLSVLVIAYENSNIDLIQNGKITNIPYLKNTVISGDKKIYSIFCKDGRAYLGLGFGVMILNLDKKEISETYTFSDLAGFIRVNALTVFNNEIFCATNMGIISGRMAANVNLLNFNNWTKHSNGIPQNEAFSITTYGGNVYSGLDNSLYRFDGTTWNNLLTQSNWQTIHLNNSNNGLQAVQYNTSIGQSKIGRWNGSSFDFLPDDFYIARPLQTVSDYNNHIWSADSFRGLVQENNNTFSAFIPNAPFSRACREMDYMNGTIYSTSSAINNGWAPNGLPEARYFSICKDYDWTSHSQYTDAILNDVNQIAVVKTLPSQNKVFFGAAEFSQGGIIEYSLDDNSIKIEKNAPGVPESFRITGAEADEYDNVWFSNAYSHAPLICRKADGSYRYFNSGYLSGELVKDVVVDDYNQIWVAKESGSGGLVMLNYGNDIDDQSDDQYFNFTTGQGYGNLPVTNVICLAKDKQGDIWLGTTKGIARITCAAYVTDNACEAEQICINRNDGSGFCDNLLEDEVVNCIKVDNANRKWIGTANGLFLVSADGLETIYKFTEDNSPLLSNVVRGITINEENGDVFIATNKGICSYRGDATTTTASFSEAFVYPNPVEHDYFGPIAIRGIPDNCTVKITDFSGNLVYQTTATGGQAVWDGNLTNGKRAATGVYFALCLGSDKKQKAKLKFVLFN